jgi:hypothetical protein
VSSIEKIQCVWKKDIDISPKRSRGCYSTGKTDDQGGRWESLLFCDVLNSKYHVFSRVDHFGKHRCLFAISSSLYLMDHCCQEVLSETHLLSLSRYSRRIETKNRHLMISVRSWRETPLSNVRYIGFCGY